MLCRVDGTTSDEAARSKSAPSGGLGCVRAQRARRVVVETLTIGAKSLDRASSIELPLGADGRLFANPEMTSVAITGSFGDPGSPDLPGLSITAIYDARDAAHPKQVAVIAPAHRLSLTPGAAVLASSEEGSIVVPLPSED